MSIGCVAIAGGPQDVVSSSGALWEHQTAETARGRKWCIRYRVTGLRNSVLAISNADWGILSVAVRSSFRSVSTSGTVEIEASLPTTRPLWVMFEVALIGDAEQRVKQAALDFRCSDLAFAEILEPRQQLPNYEHAR